MKFKKRILSVVLLVALVVGLTTFSATAAPTNYVHSIWSQTPLALEDNGTWYTPTAGNAIISWTEVPLSSGNTGFFNAIVDAGGNHYEFRLKTFTSSTASQINGTFDIYKNYTLVASSLTGSVYGLNQPVGNYFKFYDSSNLWHVSAYINNRKDY
ncbi:hypothetical protein GK047_28850 [Paenibacillus sp. SYP-B3998]|uniref:Uncharacterized protein n=1 Tax=Paenibacillus sp. SYP-B3998 TaxID=2678564 RepID=A0A6G4A6H3_9BACL|nr:hypothetical protein [Paenibacillus sp. SYP-B3998]NEW09898.1 hypothetical protein [Paenibacillus sp. SYP-B3998]